ncbi:MAG TPA: hypothetical protein VJO33_07635 [Gemmatimonadaceae bacterium]|nr:hypothetical protein [Gemmatimonadaceae bacterium]
MPTTTFEVLGSLTTASAAGGGSGDPLAGFHVSVRSPDSFFSCNALELASGIAPLRIFDGEVRARLTKSWRLSRWVDGSFWVWTAFRRQAGNGEGASGLQYDQLVPQNPTQP